MASQQTSRVANNIPNFIEPWAMGALMLAGGMGAALNLYPHLEQRFDLPLDKVLQDMGYVVHSLQALKTFLSVLIGAIGGILLLFFAVVSKVMVVRFLLACNGWFLTPKNPVNKVWYMLMLALVGSKNKGLGNYQDYLPSLPVPPLKATLKKYLNTVRPLLTSEEYEATKAAVKAFPLDQGWKLQLLLKLRSWTNRNWVKDWWADFIYLGQRSSISFNSNYFALANYKNPTPHGVDRAAAMLYFCMKYQSEVSQHTTKNAIANNVVPMCSANFKHLHCTTRIPDVERDKIVWYGHQNPTHGVVIRKGKFFALELFNPKNGKLMSPKQLKKQLEKVIELAGDEEDQSCVAAFTALPRTKWAEVRKRLEENPVNRKILKLIDSGTGLLVLQSDPVESSDLTAVSQMLFHGDVNNRWFDKSVQVMVTPNGTTGANVEHTPLDATICSQLWEYVLTSEGRVYDEQGHVKDLPDEDKDVQLIPPTKLEWELDGFQDDLKEARENLEGMIADSDLLTVTPSYGKRIPKKCRLSPDGWFQMAIQLTYYRLHQKFVLTYESATTRLYYEGRTETIRPVSDDSVAFVKSFDDPTVSRDNVKKMLKKAIEVQSSYKMEAMRGLGVDRHLFGLYVVAKGLKLDPMPKLFTDKAFNLSFTLSTSQTPVKSTPLWDIKVSSCMGGFGTVAEDGYGVSYIIVGEDDVNFSIHSKRKCLETDSRKFGDALLKAFEDMKALYSEELELK